MPSRSSSHSVSGRPDTIHLHGDHGMKAKKALHRSYIASMRYDVNGHATQRTSAALYPRRVKPSSTLYDRPMLLGRASECARVEAALQAARDGGSAALVLSGEPGIGKSALLEHALSAA